VTALCAGGTSSIRPGIPGKNIISGGVLTEGLTLISPWLLPVALLVDAFLYDATSSCTADPPALPTFTQADLSNCIGGVFNTNCPGTLAKVKDLVMRYLWFQWCKCDVGAQPTFVSPALPAGIASPVGQVTSGCFSGTFNGDPEVISGQFAPRPITLELLPVAPLKLLTDGNGNPNMAATVPAGSVLSIHITGGITFPAGVGQTWNGRFCLYNSAGTFTGDLGVSVLSNAAGTVAVDQVLTLPADTTYISAAVYQYGTVPPITTQLSAVYTCGASLSGSLDTACQSDPAVLAALQQVLDLVKLLQRQLVPLEYTMGSSHAGLSGQGTIAVSGLLGVKIELTTLPSTYTQDTSDPPYIWSAGWISMMTADGFIDEARFHATHQVWMPRMAFASVATLIGYSLKPGIVATITELLRQP